MIMKTEKKCSIPNVKCIDKIKQRSGMKSAGGEVRAAF